MKSEDEQLDHRAVKRGGRLRSRHGSRPSGRLRRRVGLLAATALLVVGVGIAPALAAAAPSSPVPPQLTTWEPAFPPWNTGLYGHGGLTVSSTDFSNFPAVPYYFFGKDASGKYLPKWVAVCIDFLHAYHTTGNSTTDLETYLPKQYAQQINQSLAAALQLAEANGLVIDQSGDKLPLQFEKQEAVNIMFSAQWYAWYLFAKYNNSNPKPQLKMTDFVDNDSTFSPDSYLAQIQKLVDEYNQAPAVNGQVIPLTDQTYTSAVDPTLSPFNVVVDAANSTPNYQDYVTISVANGEISAVRKKPFSGTINVAFEKVFNTQIDDGSNLYAAIGTPDNEQTKSLLTNAYPSNFSLSFESTFSPVGSTAVQSGPVVVGSDVTDVLTPSVASGVWPSGVSVVYGVDLYGPFSSQPVQSDLVPLTAPRVGHKTVSVSGTDPVSVSFTVPAAGYYTFVVGVAWGDQSSDTQSHLPPGYSWADKFGLQAESFMASPPPPLLFSPVGSTAVQSGPVAVGSDVTDVLTPSVANGVWPSGVSVVYGVDLYGPFSSQPVQSNSIPLTAPRVAHKTVSVSGTDPVSVSFTVPAAGYYTFVVGVAWGDQSSDTQSHLPQGYSWADKFGLKAESFMAPFTVTATTKVTLPGVSAGEVAEDGLTLSHQGTWVTDGDGNPVPVTATGIAYWVAGSTVPVQGGVPSTAIQLGTTQQLVFTSDGRQTAQVTTPVGESGYVVWVWSIAATQYHNAWSDVFGTRDEYTRSTVATFSPQGVTSVSSPVVSPGGSAVDTLTPSVSGGGAWPTLPGGGGVPVVYGVDLYGPLSSPPVQSDSVGSAPLVGHTTVTVTGTTPVKVSLPLPPTVSAAAGYYTFVVRVDRSSQTSQTQLYLPDPYSWQDQFGLVAESFVSPFSVSASSQVTSAGISAGGVAEDGLTLSHQGTWVTDGDGKPVPVTATGIAYWVAGSTVPVQGAVPSTATQLGTRQLVFTSDGTQTAQVTAPAGQSGYVVWVWSIAKTDYFNAWSDVFGNPTEYTHATVPLIPQLANTGVLLPVGLIAASISLVLLGLAVLLLRRRSRRERPRHLSPEPDQPHTR